MSETRSTASDYAGAEQAGVLKSRIIANRSRVRNTCVRVSREIHALAELSGFESRSRDCMIKAVEPLGCRVAGRLGTFDTGMCATVGAGALHVGLMAEYDALPGIGHACGHNLVAGAALTSFLLLAPLVSRLNVRISLFGTPCEELGAAKVELVESGVFDDLDYALLAHPAPVGVDAPRMAALARYRILIESDVTGHTGSYSPGLTVSEAWHFLTTSFSVVQRRVDPSAIFEWEALSTSGSAAVRARHLEAEVIIRVWKDAHLSRAIEMLIATCAAVAQITGTRIACNACQKVMPSMQQSTELSQLWRTNRSVFDMKNSPFSFPASTDLGALSQRVPCLHPYFDIGCWPAKNHDPEFADQAVTEKAHSAMINAGTVIAMMVVDLAKAHGFESAEVSNPKEESTQRS